MGQDPHITMWKGKLLLCESIEEKLIALSILEDGYRKSTKVVWDNPWEHQIWSPELHQIYGLWFIYYASSTGENKTHGAKVIGAACSPFGPYNWSQNLLDPWSIDMTTFLWHGERFVAWSGWQDINNEIQNLYIAPMISPVEVGERVLISSPIFDWELSIAPINEGPQAFIEDEELYLLYSANASWMPEYSTGVLKLVGNDPLNPINWFKCQLPLIQNAGHGMILDNEFWYHRKLSTIGGWQDREIVTVPKGILLNEKFERFKVKISE